MSTFRARRGFCGILSISILAATTALTAVPAVAETIGITSAVNLNAVGTPPTQDTRVLQVGLDMFANEKVDTGQVGQTHLIFDDGSALTIGPNSSVVLDEFVYDPEAQSGKLVVSVGKGLMRYVGGKISKKTPVVFKTPTSVIGIRGGIALIEANAPGAGPTQGQGGDAPLSAVTLIYGEDAFLQSGDRTERMTRPGSQIVQQLDRTVLPPVVVPPSVLQNALGRLEETGNADAGELVNALGASPQALAELAPAAGPDVGDEDIADSQLANLSSGNDPNVLVTLLPNLSPIDFEEPPEILVPDQAGSGSNIISDSSPVTFSGPTGAIKRAENPEFGAGFGGIDSFSPFVSISSLDGGAFSGTLLNGGTLTLPIGTDTFEATATAQPFGGGPLEGIGVLSDSGDFLFYELEDASDGSRVLAYAGNPTPLDAFPEAGVTAYELRDDFALGGVQIPFVSPFAGAGLIDAGQTPVAYINWNGTDSSSALPVLPAIYSSTIVISEQGAAQNSVASVFAGRVFDDGTVFEQPFIFGSFRGSASNATDTIGYTGDVVSGTDITQGSFFGDDGADGADPETGPENFVLQSVGAVVLPPDGDDIAYGANAVASVIDAGDAGSQQSDRTMNGWFNGFSREFDQSGEFNRYQTVTNVDAVFEALAIRTDPAENRVEASFGTAGIGPGTGIITLAFGDPEGGILRSAYIDDNRFAAIESEAGSDFGLNGTVSVVENSEIAYLVTGDQVTFDNALPSGVTICDCAFTTWGFIGVGADFTDDSGTEIHLLPWVAGDIASDIQFPTAGSATYQGTVIGTTVLGALNDPQATAHRAFGNIELQFLFGVDSGSGKTVEVLSGTITGYDNGTIALVGNGASSAPRFDFMIDAANSNIPGVFALDDEVSGGRGRFIGPNNPPENAIGTGFLVGSSTDNLSNQDYNSNFVLFTETDGSIQPVQ